MNPHFKPEINHDTNFMITPKGFFEFEGNLYRDGEYKTPTRTKFAWHFNRVTLAREVAACLRAGAFAWPGGYPLFFICDDGGALCFDCARKEFARIARSMIGNYRDGWTIAACDINHEDQDCYCAHCNQHIEPSCGFDATARIASDFDRAIKMVGGDK